MKKPSKSELPLTFDHRPPPSTSNGTRSWSATFYDVFSVDTRSLAVYRVVLASIIVLDLCNRIPDLRAHYTDEGYFPRRLMLSSWQMPGYFSIHLMNGSEFFQLLLFLANYFVAIALAVGWQTRVMTFLCWYMMYSLHARNLVILHSGDVYLRMMMLWACFMPLGAEWSIDKIKAGRSQPGTPVAAGPDQYRHFSIGGSVGSIMQLVYVYLFSTLEKHNRAYQVWYVEGSGTFWALNSLPYMRTMIGDWAAAISPSILATMTFGVLVWEMVGPVLYVFPWRNQYCRLFGIAGQFALHFGFALCLKLETFVWVGCTASFFLIPPVFWDSILPTVRRKLFKQSTSKQEMKITFTENALPLAQSIDTFLALQNVRWAELIGDPEKVYEGGLAAAPLLTVSCDEQGFVAHNEQALPFLFSHSPIAWPLAPVFSTQAGQSLAYFYFELLRARVYDTNSPPSSPRYKRTSRMPYIPSKERKYICDIINYALSPTIWANIIGTILVLYVLAWNTTNVKLPPTLPSSLQPYAGILMLDQSWHMFSPPPRHAYFHNIELNLRDGTKLELIKGGGLYRWEGVPFHTGPPLPLYENYGTHRHFKVWEVYTFAATNTDNRLEFGRWVCREWNSRHRDGKVLQNHKTWLTSYPADTPREQVEAAYRREILWDHNCF